MIVECPVIEIDGIKFPEVMLVEGASTILLIEGSINPPKNAKVQITGGFDLVVSACLSNNWKYGLSED